MRRTFVGWMTATVLGAFLVAGCGGGGGNASNFAYDPPPGPTPAPQQEVNFRIPAYGAGDQAVLVFTPVSGDEWDQAANQIQVHAANARQAADASAQGQATFFDPCGTDRSVKRFDQVVGTKARLQAASLRPRAVQARWDGMPLGTVGTMYKPMGVASTDIMDVTKMTDDAQTVHCTILAETVGGVPVITAADALRMAQIFDSTNPFDPQTPGAIGIYDRITGLCGTEWRTNPVGGRDGDTRVNLVVLSANTMSLSGGILFGMVRFEDAFATSVAPLSNEGEYVYLNYEFLGVPAGTDRENYSLYGTLAHEFLHVVQVNTKIAQNGLFPNFDPNTPSVNNSAYSLWERRTMAEGFCETAATLCGFGVQNALNGTPTGGAEILSYDAINRFLGGTSLIVPGMTGATLVGSNFWTPFLDGGDPYGIGHLFGLYVVNRYGAAKWGQLTSSTHIGLLNLNTVLGAAPEDIFHGFNLALHCASLNGAPPQYDLPKLQPGGVNFVRTFQKGDAVPPVVHLLNAAGFASSGGPTVSFTQSYAPWSTVLLGFLGGNGAPLNLQVVLPLKARASVIYESPKGTFNSLQ